MSRNLFLKFLRKNQTQILKIILLILILAIYSWFFFRNLAMLPDPNDPLEYIEPAVWGTFVGIFPFLDRIIIADGIRLFSFIIPPLEIAGAVYFGTVNYLILIVAMSWAYRRKGFWAAFLTGFFLLTSYPLLRYANYGYPDATVTLFSLLAIIFFFSSRKNAIIWGGLFTALAFFSKVTGLAMLIFFLADLILQKNFGGVKKYFFGLLLGILLTLGLTGTLFGLASLKEVFLKLGLNISSNIEHRDIITSSIYNILRPEVLLPGYLALLVFIAGYKDYLVRKLFLAAWFFLAFFSLLVIFSRHIIVYPHYLYTSYILALIGMSFYLASFFPKLKKNGFFLLALSALALVFLGITIGLSKPNYLEGFLKFAPNWFKFSYFIFFLGVVLLMIAMEKFKNIKLFILFFLMMAFFDSLFTSASAYSYIYQQKLIASSVYTFARVLGKSPSPEVKIYADSLEEASKVRALWTYSLFYDRQHNRESVAKNRSEIAKNIIFIKQQDLDNDWHFLLTDNAQEVSSKFPQARIIEFSSDPGYYLFYRP